MKRRLSFLLFCLAAPLVCPAEATGPALELRSSATVSGELVRLADIVRLPDRTDPRLAGLVIGVSPRPGAAMVFPRREVCEKLAGNGFSATRLEGAEQVRVERSGRLVEPSFFRQLIADYLARNSRWGDGLSVTTLPGGAVTVPETDVSWSVQPANGEEFFGNVLFRVSAAIDGREIYSGWVTARLKIEKRVAVSNRPLNKGEAIGPADIRWETREITPLTRDALLSESEVVGRRTGRIIRSNTVLTGDLLENDCRVRRGQSATLTVTYRTVRVTSLVQVLNDGNCGDRVQAVNESSKQVLTARVTGPGQLEVEVP
jgi:flagella basal body P-ring formation protein FlgA